MAATRNRYDRRFAQAEHGDQEHGQSPYSMFLETWGSHSCPEVGIFGKQGLIDVARDRESLMSAILRVIDGRLTTFDQDDGSTRLEAAPDGSRRPFRLEFLNPAE